MMTLKKSNLEFQTQVLVHLEYMRKKQDEHDEVLKEIKDNFSNQVNTCGNRFKEVEDKITKAEGIFTGSKVTALTIWTIITIGVGWLISLFQK